MLQPIFNIFKEIIAPKMCCHCGTFFTFLCQNCYEQIDFSFAGAASINLPQNKVYLDSIQTVGTFSGPLKSLVLALKYQGILEVAYTLASLSYHAVCIPNCDVITFIPAHQQRIKDRGFNQSKLLAQHLAALLKKPCIPTLSRSKKMAAQASIHNKSERQQRQQNTMQPTALHNLNGKTVLLIDDVFTTGATLNEAARVLKLELGAKQAIGFTIAQA